MIKLLERYIGEAITEKINNVSTQKLKVFVWPRAPKSKNNTLK